ncbi:hypothetical protein N2152v2_007525 [Parachlorella kessleri]
MITSGKDKGQVGTVLKVIRDTKFPRVLVEGLNLTKRHVKRAGDNPGGIISVESPLHYSNVALIDPINNEPVRAAFRWLEDGTKVRVSRGRMASGSIIPRPDVLKQRRKPLPIKAGPQDTVLKEAAQQTHRPGDLPSFLKVQLAQQAQQQRQFSSSTGGSSSPLLSAGSRITTSGASTLLSSRWQLWRGFAASAW